MYDYNKIKEEIKLQIKNDDLILFIGAGVPASLEIPDWNDLISLLAKDLDYDPDIFKLYGDFLSLAEYYRIEKENITELIEYMNQNWRVDDEVIKSSEIYKCILKMNCSIIYTTNYENSLERAFEIEGKPFRKIVNLESLVELTSNETQIIKFHGDLSETESIVLTESNYFERLNFESELDIKLRSDILGKSILFIGYSLSDINIRLLLYKLDSLWRKTNKNNRPKSYIFMPKYNPIQEKIFHSRGIEPIFGTEIDKKLSLEKFLRELVQN